LPVSVRVLAFFGTLGAAKLFDWVMTSWQKAFSQERPVALVVIGDRPKVHVPAFLSAFFKPLGFLPTEAVSKALQAIDVLALPFFDGVSERRGSFMAGLDHGCAIVTTIGFSTGPTLRKARFFEAVTVTERDAFAEKAKKLLLADHQRRELGHAARQAYQSQYQWPRLTEKLLVQLNKIRRLYPRLENPGIP
jgi:glycosyltransferase involved in cell wall biosynthesis